MKRTIAFFFAFAMGCSCSDPDDPDAGMGMDGGMTDAGMSDGGRPTDAVITSDPLDIDAGMADAGGPRCGNGVIEPPEACDDGDTMAGDGCSDVCALEVAPGCGNGVREIGEACDDGNTVDTDACLTTCAAASCGDGVVRTDLAMGAPGYEACDDGNGSDFDGCLDTTTCAVAACGDGITRRDLVLGQPGYETCDDGNTTPGDGCGAICLIEGTCGDGLMTGTEMCDLGMNNDDEASGACPSVCRRNCQCPSCGDGVADFARGEQCDDGNVMTGDGCGATCLVEASPTCGDGALDVGNGEECDDNNTAAGDGCDASCQLEPLGAMCGDSAINPPLEVCDPPEVMPADGSGCNATCNLRGQVTTLATGVDTLTLASDNTYLYVAVGGCGTPASPACGIGRIDIAACTAAPGTAACQPTTFVVGGTGRCSCAPAAMVDGAIGVATVAPIGTMTTDGTTIWFANRQTLREANLATGTVRTVAGNDGSCAAIDGIGRNALFHDIRGLTYWNGYVYLLDGCEEVLRRYDPMTGAVVTLAGTRQVDPGVTQSPPYACPSAFRCVTGAPLTEGYGTSAVFGSPRYMTADNAGNLYFIDTNGQAIWRYNTVTTYAEILIQGGAPGVMTGLYSDGMEPGANLGRPRSITSDGTSIYFGEQNYATVRQLLLSTRNTTTFVGAAGCAANDPMASTPGVRDGLGADTRRLFCRGGGGPALTPTVPVFNNILGALTFNYAHRSIFIVDGGVLRRIQ